METKTMQEALTSEHTKEWKTTADSECDSLMANKIRELFKLPGGHKPIGCKLVFKVKHNSDDKVELYECGNTKYKALQLSGRLEYRIAQKFLTGGNIDGY